MLQAKYVTLQRILRIAIGKGHLFIVRVAETCAIILLSCYPVMIPT